MDGKINYSIIIPHKNIPELLQRCLDSIPRREDVQIIVVDDNSDPDKMDFEHFPGLGDPFVEVVFTKEGKGAGYARNVGLTKATGKWLLFADADDFYNNCANDIFNDYIDLNEDIIYFKHNSLYSDTYKKAYRNNKYNTYIDYWLCSKKKCDYLLKYKITNVVGKIFNNDFIRNNKITFDEVSISDDVTFMYLAGFYANFIQADSRILYCETIRQNSITYSRKTIEKKLDKIYVRGKCYRFFMSHDIPFPHKMVFKNFLTEFYFFNRSSFGKAKEILLGLGFSSEEIIRLIICNIIFYIPQKIIVKLFSQNNFLLILYLKFKHIY